MAVDKVFVVKTSQPQECTDAVVTFDIEQVLYCPTLRVFRSFRYLIALQPVAATLLGEEHHRVVHGGRIDELCEILFTAVGTLAADTTTGLLAELRQWSALDISQMTDRNHHRIVGIEVFGVELFARVFDFSTAFITILFLHFLQFILHHLLAKFRVIEYRLQIGNLALQFFIFGMQLIHTQTCQLAQAHVNDGLRLQFVKFETLFQVALCIRRCLGGPNDVYHLVDIVTGDNQSFKDMCPFLCLAQFKFGTTDGDIMSVVNKVHHTFLQCEQFGATLNQSDAIH